jgi:hypothetical protein
MLARLSRRGSDPATAPRGTVLNVIAVRQCSRPSCSNAAAATLTYVYEDQTVVVGQLSAQAEPHAYDLCAHHADRFTAPRGWDVVHIHQELVDRGPSDDDLDALARAVRQAGTPPMVEQVVVRPPLASEPRRGHLRVVSADG